MAKGTDKVDALVYGNWSERVDGLQFRLASGPADFSKSGNRHTKLFIEVKNVVTQNRRLPWFDMLWEAEV